MTYRRGHHVKNLGANLQLRSLLLHLVHQGMANLAIVDDARGGHPNSCDAGNVGLYFFRFFRG